MNPDDIEVAKITYKKEYINKHINNCRTGGQNKNEIPYATVINEDTVNTTDTDPDIRNINVDNIIDPIGSNIVFQIIYILLDFVFKIMYIIIYVFLY